MSDQHTTVQYQLRLPEELRDEIKESAKTHNRSMNADIVARLEQSFDSKAEQVFASKYEALHNEYMFTKNLLDEISTAVLRLKESVDSDDKFIK